MTTKKKVPFIIAIFATILLGTCMLASQAFGDDEPTTQDEAANDSLTAQADEPVATIKSELTTSPWPDATYARDNVEISDNLNYEAPAGTLVIIKGELSETKDNKIIGGYEKALLLGTEVRDVTDRIQRAEDGSVTNMSELRAEIPENELGKTILGSYAIEMTVNAMELGGYSCVIKHEVLYASDNTKVDFIVEKAEKTNQDGAEHTFDSVFFINPKFEYTVLPTTENEAFKIHVKFSGLIPNSPYRTYCCVGPKGHDKKIHDDPVDKAKTLPNTPTLAWLPREHVTSNSDGVVEYDITHTGKLTQDEINNTVVNINLLYGEFGYPVYVQSFINKETGEVEQTITSGPALIAPIFEDNREFGIAELGAVASAINESAETNAPAQTVSETADGLAPELVGIIGIALASLIAAGCIASRRRDKRA